MLIVIVVVVAAVVVICNLNCAGSVIRVITLMRPRLAAVRSSLLLIKYMKISMPFLD